MSIYVDQYTNTYISNGGEAVDCPNLATTVERASGTEEWTTTVPAWCIAAGTYPMLVNRYNIEGWDTSNTFGPVDLTSPGLLVNANVQVDALPGSQLAGALLYVPADGPVPQVVLDEVARLNPTLVLVLGGQGAASDDVAAQVQFQTAHRVN